MKSKMNDENEKIRNECENDDVFASNQHHLSNAEEDETGLAVVAAVEGNMPHEPNDNGVVANFVEYDICNSEHVGYTPLDDLDIPYSSMLMAATASGNDDNDDEGEGWVYNPSGRALYFTGNMNDNHDIEDDNDGCGGSSGGLFYADASAFPTTHAPPIHRDHDSNADDDENRGKEDGEMDINFDFDFREIADQALRSLDEEYLFTVRATVAADSTLTCDADDDMEKKFDTTVISDYTEKSKSNSSCINIGGKKEVDETKENNLEDSPGQPSLRNASASSFSSSATTAEQSIKSCNPSNNSSTKINKVAIQKALQNIRKSSPSLTQTLDNWKPNSTSQVSLTVPTKHPIIPSTPLLAFRRRTAKAIQATFHLSRSATIAEALVRLSSRMNLLCRDDTTIDKSTMNLNGTKENNYNDEGTNTTKDEDEEEMFVIHVIGCDHVECQSEETIRTAFAPLVRWIHAAAVKQNVGTTTNVTETDNAVRLDRYSPNIFNLNNSNKLHVRIELLGPNVPLEAERRNALDLLSPPAVDHCKTKKKNTKPSSPSSIASCTLVCKNILYHDYLSQIQFQQQKNDSASCTESEQTTSMTRLFSVPYQYRSPNLAISFNAGIWGYDEWKPTLEAMSLFGNDNRNEVGRKAGPFPFVITAYTLQEAQDDAEVLEEVVTKLHHCHNKSDNSSRGVSNDAAIDNEHNDSLTKSKCLWEAEVNPFGSRKERATATAISGRIYHENGAWQAWLMGTS